MDFPGVNYRSGALNDEFDELVNVSHVDEDTLLRRPGFTKFSTTAWRTGIQFNGYLLVADVDNLTFKNINLSSGTATTNASSPTNAAVGSLVAFANRVYYADGTMAKVFESPTGTYRQAGITAPAGTIGSPAPAGGGAMTAGDHLFRYRYQNSSTTYISNPSGATQITVTANQQVTFTVGTHMTASGDSQVDKIILEASPASAATFYRVGTCNNTGGSTVTMSLSDANLLYQTPSSLYGDDGHAEMPAFDHICEHRGRIFGVKGTLLAWSRGGLPESFDLTQYARKIPTVETTAAITGMASFAGDLYIFTAYSATRFTYVDDPALGSFILSPTTLGLWNPRCLTTVDGRVFGFGPTGAWKMSAMNPVLISSKVDPYLEANVVTGSSAKFFTFFDRRDRSVTFMFVTGSDTFPQDGVTLGLRSNAWSVREYEHGMEAAANAYGEGYLATANAYTWKLVPSAFDGAPSGTVAWTTTTGSTTTVIQVTISPSSTFIGTHLRIGDEVRLISNIVAGAITVSSAFSQAPAAGVTAQAATISVRMTKGWARSAEVGAKLRGCYLLVQWDPTTGGAFRAQHYLDFSATPVTWRKDLSDVMPQGVTCTDGALYASISADTNTDGYAPVPLVSTNCRVIKPRLTTYDLLQTVSILSFEYTGWEQAKKLPGVGE